MDVFSVVSKKIKFGLKSIQHFFPFSKGVIQHLLSLFSRLENKILFGKKDYTIYPLNKNVYIQLYKNSFLTNLILDDFEFNERAFFSYLLKEGDIVLDVGANIGLHTLLSANLVGNSGVVYAFEPSKKVSDVLLSNLTLNNFTNVQLFNFAVSNESNQNLKLYENSDGFDALNNLIKPISENDFETNVSTITLDDFVEKEKVDKSRIRLIKIDVEGWELNVLKGSQQLISRPIPMAWMVEFNTWKESNSYWENPIYKVMEAQQYEWYMFANKTKKLIKLPRHLVFNHANFIAVNSQFKGKYPHLF